MGRKLKVIFGAGFIAGVIMLLSPLAPRAYATVLNYKQAIMIRQSPIYAMPSVQSDTVSTTAELAIADCTTATEANIQRLLIQNTDGTDNLCVYWVAAAASCGSSYDCNLAGTNDGVLLLPKTSWSIDVACDLRTCVVGDAASVSYQVVRGVAP